MERSMRMLLALVVMVSSISFSMFLSASPVQAQPHWLGEEEGRVTEYIVTRHPELLKPINQEMDAQFLKVLQAEAPGVWAESMKEGKKRIFKSSLLREFRRQQRGYKDGWIEYDAISTIKVPTEAEIEAMDKDELDAEYARLCTMPISYTTPTVILDGLSRITSRLGKIIEEGPVSPPARPMFPAQPFSSSSSSDEEDLGAIPGPVRPGARPVPARAPLGVLPPPPLRSAPFNNIQRVKGTQLQDILARYNTVSEAALTADQRQRRTEIIQELQRREDVRTANAARPAAAPPPARPPRPPRAAAPPPLRSAPFTNIKGIKATSLHDLLRQFNTTPEADWSPDQRQRRTEILQELLRREEERIANAARAAPPPPRADPRGGPPIAPGRRYIDSQGNIFIISPPRPAAAPPAPPLRMGWNPFRPFADATDEQLRARTLYLNDRPSLDWISHAEIENLYSELTARGINIPRKVWGTPL